MKSIHLNLCLGFCILIMFTENSFAQEDFRTVYPYGGVPDSSRCKSGRNRVPLNFNYSADFRGAVFDSGAYFEEAIFANTADFSGVTFNKIADFREAKFANTADFHGAIFDGTAHFSRGAIFDSLADFSEATFADEVHFQKATFANTADFHGVTFNRIADFREAKFTATAEFSNATFATVVYFKDATFDGAATFSNAKFAARPIFRDVKFNSGAYFVAATLAEADFVGVTFADEADFSRANLSKANLSKANLSGANLSKADLRGVNLNGTIAEFADFSSCFFEPADITDLRIIGAKGLSTIRFKNPKAVIEFRVVLKRSSLRNEERALTSALRKYQLLGVSPYAKFFEKYLLGGKLTDYGAQPWGSLAGLFWVFIIFFIIYLFVPKKANARWGGIVVTWNGQFQMKSRFWRKWQRLRARWFRHVRIGLYFSLLSSFRIGWRELNVGNWITRLQSLECSLRPTGWVRTISGIQSLISVYLLALWLLTYFGRPFE